MLYGEQLPMSHSTTGRAHATTAACKHGKCKVTACLLLVFCCLQYPGSFLRTHMEQGSLLGGIWPREGLRLQADPSA